MKQKLKKKDVGFTQIKNEVLENKKLSLKAKGMFCYLYSKPEDWDFSTERIVKVSSDGSRSTIGAIKELEEAGYLTRKRLKTGKVEYHLTFEPNVQNAQEETEPDVQNAKETKRPNDETHDVSNKEDNTNTEEETNTSLSASGKESSLEKEVAEVIDTLKNLNPAYKLLFARKPQRESCKRLLQQHGLEKVKRAIQYLEHCVQSENKYCPTITTPIQLEEKWGALAIAWMRENKNSQKGGVHAI